MTIKEFANSVKTAPSIDPITISIIVNICIFILQNCILNRKTLKNPNPLQRWRLRQICYKADKANWRQIYAELLNSAKTVSEDQLRALYEDSKTYPPQTI